MSTSVGSGEAALGEVIQLKIYVPSALVPEGLLGNPFGNLWGQIQAHGHVALGH